MSCIAGLCAFTAMSFGQGSIYSFSGTISRLDFDGAGILGSENVQPGDSVSVSYYVDFNRSGYYLLNNGTMEVLEDAPLGNVHSTYFYSELISGTLFEEVNGGWHNRPEDINRYFAGWNRFDPTGHSALLQGGTADSFFTVRYENFATPLYVQDWSVGTELQGVIGAWSDQDWSFASADMRLDSITPVPEPRMALMAATTAAILLGIRFRGNRRS